MKIFFKKRHPSGLREIYLCGIKIFSYRKRIPGWFQMVSYEDLLADFLYYVPNSDVFRPKILNIPQTLDKLLHSRNSIARYGDGEMEIMNGGKIPFQDYDEELANRLKSIIKTSYSNVMLGIPYTYFFPKFLPERSEEIKQWNYTRIPKYRRDFLQCIDKGLEYCAAEISTLYAASNEIYTKFKQIWDNRDIAIVTCKSLWDKVEYNIFDNARKIHNIWVPNKNAWSDTDRVINDVCKLPKDVIIILMCGPAATVWAVDLAKHGYRALDIGHVLKGYDLYMKTAMNKDTDRSSFYAPD